MTAIFSPAVRLRRRLMYANFGDVIDHCRSVVGWEPDDTADILIAVGGDRARFGRAIDAWLRLDELGAGKRPGASTPGATRHLMDFIKERRL